MKSDTTRRIIIWTSVAAIFGVGGYLAYKKLLKPYLDKRKAEGASNLPPVAETTPTGAAPVSDADLREAALKDGKHIYVKNGKYFTTGKDAEGSFRIKADIEILKPKGSILNLQTFLNGKGEKLKEDGIWGKNTANAMVKWVKAVGTGGVGWSINDNQKSVSYY